MDVDLSRLVVEIVVVCHFQLLDLKILPGVFASIPLPFDMGCDVGVRVSNTQWDRYSNRAFGYLQGCLFTSLPRASLERLLKIRKRL